MFFPRSSTTAPRCSNWIFSVSCYGEHPHRLLWRACIRSRMSHTLPIVEKIWGQFHQYSEENSGWYILQLSQYSGSTYKVHYGISWWEWQHSFPGHQVSSNENYSIHTSLYRKPTNIDYYMKCVKLLVFMKITLAVSLDISLLCISMIQLCTCCCNIYMVFSYGQTLSGYLHDAHLSLDSCLWWADFVHVFTSKYTKAKVCAYGCLIYLAHT